MSQSHPDLSELLLWQSGDLDREESVRIEAHLSGCTYCNEEIGKANSLLEDVAIVDIAATQRQTHTVVGEQRQAQKQQVSSRRKRLVKAVTAGTAVITSLVLVVTTLTPSARADSWLTEASARERTNRRERIFLHVKRGREGGTCHVAIERTQVRIRSVSTSSDFCRSVESSLQKAGWDWKDLLSAESFQRWRRALPQRTDAIESRGDYRSITTATNGGLLRIVTIRLRNPDYGVLSTSFELRLPNGFERFDVSEDTNAPQAETADTVTMPQSIPVPMAKPRAARGELVDPLDSAEIELRLILHQRGQDRNPLISVERNREFIELRGIVPTDSMKQRLYSTMALLPSVRVSVVSEMEAQQSEVEPGWKAFHGDTPPLAAEKIRTLFHNNPEARSRFVNGLDATTRHLVGATQSREAIVALASRARGSVHSTELSTAVAELERDTLADAAVIATQLRPLLGVAVLVRKAPMTLAEGNEIYELVHEVVFLSNSSKGLTLESALLRLQEILSSQQ